MPTAAPLSEPGAGDAPRASALATLAITAVAFAVYGSALPRNAFGDGVHLAHMIERGPAPYYNLGYVPAAWTLHRMLAPLIEWTPIEAMGWFSVGCGAAAVALTWRLLVASGAAPVRASAVTALLAFTPGTYFFATATEVHALQLLGIAVGCACALRARCTGGARRFAWIAAAALAPFLAHATGLLMAPAVAALALGPRGRSPRALAFTGAALAAGLGLGLGLAALAGQWTDARGGPERVGLDFSVAFDRGQAVVDRTVEGSVRFTTGEAAEYVLRELVLPAALLLLALPLAFARANRALLLPLALALAPGLLVYPQGHVLEHGAYYVSVYPFLALLLVAPLLPGARHGAVAALAIALLALPQAWLALRKTAAFERGADVWEWGADVKAALAADPGAPVQPTFLLVTQPRTDWITYFDPIGESVDACGVLETAPLSMRKRAIQGLIVLAGERIVAGGRVYLDSALFDDPDRPSSFADFDRRLRELPVVLAPVRGRDGQAPLYELRVAESVGAAPR